MKGSFKKESKRDGLTWMFRVDIGLDERGKRKQATRRGFKTRKEAEKACNQIIHQVTKGTFVEPSKCTLEEFILDWLENTVKQRVRIVTYDSYYGYVRKLIHKLGKIQLDKLTPMHIQKCYAYYIEEGLSEVYVRSMHKILSNALDQAVKWKMIAANPAKLTSPPKIPYKEQQTWSIGEANRFLKHTQKEPIHIAYLLAIYTGMRRGEILGLRWKDCDLEKKLISIRQTVALSRKGPIFQETKTRSSRRVIAISDEVVDELRKHKRQQNLDKKLLGEAYTDKNLVVCTSNGNPYRNLRRHFLRMIQESKVPKIRFHDIRHTHATIMLQIGEHPKVVSERLGHSRTSVTLDVYSHVVQTIQEEAAKNFSDAFQTIES